jgi:predicted ATP-grasp superfamily ATP-dependent carboligase
LRAIVLDGEQRSALAVTRSLGKRGIRVAVGSGDRRSLSSVSRYCTDAFLYPSPHSDPAGFLEAVSGYANRMSPSVLFPMTDVSLTEVLRNKALFSEAVLLPFVEFEKYLHVTDKAALFRLADTLGVSIPGTVISADCPDRGSLCGKVRGIGYPVVVKPCFSKIRTGNSWTGAGVQYVSNEEALLRAISRDPFRSTPFLIQERIDGPGVGIFLLLKDGRLLEVNGRFWGSLQLAVAAGVDFPYMLFQLATGESAGHEGRYQVGVRSRWELGDLDHLLLRMRRRASDLNLPAGHLSRHGLLAGFLGDFFRPSVHNEIFRVGDMKPFFCELKEYLKAIF